MQLIRLLNRAIAYLEGNLTQPASIEEAAALIGYSRFHFSRTFLATTGITPVAYLRKRRLSEAARQLTQSSKPILEIAFDYQFQSQEAFSRSFKQEFGVSPGLYRLRGRLRWLLGKITLGPSRLLYPGRGIERKPQIIVPERKIMAAILLSATRQEPLRYQVQEVALTHNHAALNPVKIRQAQRQDIPALCRLYHTLHQFTVYGVPERLQSLGEFECYDATGIAHTLETLIAAVPDTAKDADAVAIWVAEVDGQVVGLAEVYLREDQQNTARVSYRYGYLQSLVVEPRLRGRGMGKQLLAAAEKWCKEQAASELRLETWEFERGPLAFYTQQGYRTLRRTLVRKV